MSWNKSADHCQPCADFKPRLGFWGGMEVHECFAPFNEPGAPKCAGRVVFCESCFRDHHEGGYETCGGIEGALCGHVACAEALARRRAAETNSDPKDGGTER